jgi:hypothetical protein
MPWRMSGIRIEVVADWSHRSVVQWRGVVVLEAYFDESGTQGEALITSIAGYVATRDEWIAVEKGVNTFHMTDCLAQEGEFAFIEKPHVNSIIILITKAMGRHLKARPICSAVVNEDWNAVVTDKAFLARFPKPFDLCFDDVVRQLAEWARRNAGGEIVAPMFAFQPEYAERMTAIGAAYGKEAWYRNVLGPIAFGYPQQVIALQCADAIAHQTNYDVKRGEYERLTLATGGPTVALHNAAPKGVTGHVFDERSLQITVERFTRTGEIYRV